MTHEVAEIFQQNIREPTKNMTTLQVKCTVRDRISSILIFTSESILCQVKLNVQNNIIHILLQDSFKST